MKMLNYIKTAEMHGITEEEARAYFVKYPKSGKKVVTICETCLEERIVTFAGHTKNCLSCARKLYWRDDAKRAEVSAWMTKHWSDPENRAVYAEKMKAHYLDPEFKRLQSVAKSKYWAQEMSRENMSKTMLESEAHRIASEKMVGGNDIVNHHYIYDPNDKHKFTTPMTRSEHTSMHVNIRSHEKA